jgi:hypothetical protein
MACCDSKKETEKKQGCESEKKQTCETEKKETKKSCCK